MTTIDFTGNLAEDPKLTYTPSGVPVANFVVIENRRTKNGDGEWVDAEPNRYRVKAWRSLAENIAETLATGMNVMVKGSLQTERYDKDGETRFATTIVAESVGVSLQWQTAQVEKSTKPQRSADPFEPEPAY